MNSAIGALIGLAVAIFLIVKRLSPVYSLMLGALTGGLLSGFGLVDTVDCMVSGVRDIAPAILRILAAGVLSGVLIKTGAAASISRTIVRRLGARQIYLALAVSAMLLTGVGVFVDVAVITVAPIALMLGKSLSAPKPKLLLAMIGGAKCGNVISPNPNTIIAAENFGAPLPSVMAANIVPAIIGLLVTVYVIVPLVPSSRDAGPYSGEEDDVNDDALPSFLASIAAPAVTMLLLALRPLAGIVIDPLVALPAGGIAGILATRSWKRAGESVAFGLEKMSVVAVLLVGTGTIAGIIKASEIKDVMIAMLSGWSGGGTLMAPLASILMAAATASTTAGATIASASFSQTVLAAGVPAVWAAAMTNAGATVLDHLPHGSFFHATGGSVGMQIKERLRLIPFESAVGLTLTVCSLLSFLIFGR
ncbi:MAG: GntP family permease [Bacteroidales bacterium]|nr:GntP family permease [Bacteroidales bacterium]